MHDSKTAPFEKPLRLRTFEATRSPMVAQFALALHFACCLVLGAMSPIAAAEGSQRCEAHSPAHRISLLELYTSEGCNSCPPADRWFSTLPERGFTPERVIPLAFHVDYWDQLGWPDRMAKAQFSARQRAQAPRNRSGFVYTPQLLLNGADYRMPLSDGSLSTRLDELDRVLAGAELALLQRAVDSKLEVELEVALPRVHESELKTYVVITENRLQSEIKAGENRGKHLHHDFVVREFVGPLPAIEDRRMHWKAAMALREEWKRADLSLVAFVQDERSGDILQALKAPFCYR